MRTAIRVVKRVLVGVLCLVILALGLLYGWSTWRLERHYEVQVEQIVIPADAASIERGRHLAENVSLCNHCHGADFGGKRFFDGGALVARLSAPNLTRGRGGIGAAYTDRDWVRSLRHGVAPGGRALVVMPSADFARYSAEDLRAIIAYVKSRPPVDREWPAVSVGPVGRAMLFAKTAELLPVLAIDHGQPIATAVAAADVVDRGRHIVSVAGCQGCHSPDFTGGQGPPPGAANITPVGIGAWSERDFVTALRTGVAPGNRALAAAMPRAYGAMTDDELHAVWSYLRTVPAGGEKTPRQKAGTQLASASGAAATAF